MIRIQGIPVVAERLSAKLKSNSIVETPRRIRGQRTRQSLFARRSTTAGAPPSRQSTLELVGR